MLDSQTTIRYPHEASGRRNDHDHPDPRASVSMKTEGLELLLFFKDLSGEGDILEMRLIPETHPISPQALRRIAAKFPVYVQYARAAIRWDKDDVRANLQSLREIGKTSRKLPPDHYILIARRYLASVAEGEPHPVKALGEALHTDISNASRWVKEAKRRGLIPTA